MTSNRQRRFQRACKSWCGVCSLVILGWVAVGEARTVMFAGTAISVTLQVGHPTSITFPERIDESQPIDANDENHLSIEIDRNRVFLLPRHKDVTGRLFVPAPSGVNYILDYTTGKTGDVDIIIQRPQPPPQYAPGPIVPRGTPVRDMLFALYSRKPPPGARVQKTTAVLFTPAVSTTDVPTNIYITAVQVYTVAPYYGYIAIAENRGSTPEQLRLPDYDNHPGLRAIGRVGDLMLAPKTHTWLYYVFKKEKR